MKLLHLATHLNTGGIARYLFLLGRQQVRQGHQVAILSSGGDTTARCEQAGIRCVVFRIRTKNELHPKLFWAHPQITRFIREEGFDLLHAHTRVTQVLTATLSRQTSIPYVTTCHGFFRRRLGRRLFPCWGERTIAISPPVARHLTADHGVDPDRVRTIMNAIDVDELLAAYGRHNPAQIRDRYGIPRDAVVVGSVGRLVAEKGRSYLIQALARLRHDIPKARVLIVGEGRRRPALQRIARRAGVGGAVHFIGGVADVSEPLAAMDFFTLPTVWREGFGLVVAEAMTVGKPVVVSDIEALNTIVHDGEDGYLVPLKNPAALAERLASLIRSPEQTRAVALRGQARARREFTIDRQAREVEAVYGEVCRKTN
ncbi:MAG: glycosyltransferase family 4 protein [Candidatus Omnitrophica bacterium]|nr:glycosyltransferase family 4 protein [Candidatus Omnitrophota bacterium]